MAHVFKWLALAAVYVAAAYAGWLTAAPHLGTSPLWPPAGLALGAVARFGLGLWPGVALGALAAALIAGEPPAGVVSFVAAETVSVAAGAAFVRAMGVRPDLRRLRDALLLLLAAGAVLPPIGALVRWALLNAAGLIDGKPDGMIVTWWLGRAAGATVLAPFTLTWSAKPARPNLSAWEMAAFAAGITLCNILIFGGWLPWGWIGGSTRFALLYPMVIGAGLAFGPRGAATTLAAILSAAVGYIAAQGGGRLPAAPDLVRPEVFLCVVAWTGLVPAALWADRQAVLAALAESERHYRAVVGLQTEFICRFKPDTTLTFVNEAICRFQNVRPDQLLGRQFLPMLPEADREAVAARLASVTPQNPVVTIEHGVIRADGAVRIVEWTDRAVFDDAGRVTELQSVGRDITEQKAAERELRQKKELLETVLDHVPVMISFYRPGREVMYVNREVERVFGPRGDAIDFAKAMADTYPDPEVRRRVIEHMSAIPAGWLDTDAVARGELRRHAWAAVRLSDGTAVGIGMDVTDRTRAESALRESEGQLRAVFEAASDALAVFDDEGRCVRTNPAFRRLFGTEGPGTPVRNAAEWLAPDGGFPGELARLRREGRRAGGLRLSRAGGSVRDVEFACTADILPGRHLAVLRDVTERRSLEEQLRHALKMDAVGRLAGVVAHDFNGLLMAVMIHSGMLLRALPEGHPVRRDAEQIRKAADRAAALSRQLLAFSRRQVLRPEVLDLNAVVAETVGVLRRLVGGDVEVVVAGAGRMGKVKADRAELEQVIITLAVRARDAMPKGGRLMLRTFERELRPDHARRRLDVSPGVYAVLSMTDDGPALDERARERIFEPAAGGDRQDAGLGLAGAFGIIKQSGGHIEAGPAPGGGTVIEVMLPCLADPSEASHRALPALRGSETVLVAEDDPIVRSAICTVLMSQGYTVLEAADGASALAASARHPGPVHLLVADVIMPGMGGRALAAAITTARPEIKPLYISGYTDDTVFTRGGLEAGTPVLAKPFTPESLSAKVREALDGRPVAQPAPPER